MCVYVFRPAHKDDLWVYSVWLCHLVYVRAARLGRCFGGGWTNDPEAADGFFTFLPSVLWESFTLYTYIPHKHPNHQPNGATHSSSTTHRMCYWGLSALVRWSNLEGFACQRFFAPKVLLLYMYILTMPQYGRVIWALVEWPRAAAAHSKIRACNRAQSNLFRLVVFVLVEYIYMQ